MDRASGYSITSPVNGTIEYHWGYTDIPLHLLWNFSTLMFAYAGVDAAFWNTFSCKGTGVYSSISCSTVSNVPPAIYPPQVGFGFHFGKNFETALFYEAATQINNSGTAVKSAGMGLALNFIF